MVKRKMMLTKRTPVGGILVVFLVIFCGFVFADSASAYTYTIEYRENVASNMPESVIGGLSASSSVPLSSSSPLRSGFTFLGWCDQATTKTYDTDVCASGHQHQPSNTVALDATASANTIKLYAMWTKTVQSSCPSSPLLSTVVSGITYMQDIDSSNSSTVLSSLTSGNTYQIKDSRDDETYCVGKLVDGKLWLLDNLALDLADSTILNGISASNTNASDTTIGFLRGTTTGTASDKYATTAVTDDWNYNNSYSAPLINLNNKYTIPTDSISVSGGYKVGGYYNYCAATAGSYCYGNGTSYGTSSGDATEDICPKGWRLPTGYTGEYQTLYYSLNNNYVDYRNALRLPISGNSNYGSEYNQGVVGYFWSSTRSSNENMYGLSITDSGILPSGTNSRDSGRSVRCVLNYTSGGGGMHSGGSN